MLLESKSNLAKLMASENIVVEQKQSSTAYFNLKTRTLVIPTLKENLSLDLYDLFIGHEIGHALNTPEQGWHDSIVDLGIKKSILNVCEDVRIEKLIRRKFPGLKASFIRAYNELMQLDFFEIERQNIDVQTLNLIDRINLYSKVGVSTGITFSEEEKPYVEESNNAETWQDVVDIALKIQEYMKQQNDNKSKAKVQETIDDKEKSVEGGDIDSDETEQSTEQEYQDQDGVTGEDQDQDGVTGEDQDQDGVTGEDQDQDGETGDSGMQSGELGSMTDDSFRKNEKQMYDSQKSDTMYGNIPSIDSEDYIVTYKELYKAENIHRNVQSTMELYHTVFKKGEYSKFRKSVSKTVEYLTKEFEMKKNAQQLKKASTSRTGELDMKRIYSYKLTDDIFKKLSVVPNAKSHGLVLFLDWSGSMSGYMQETIKQLLTLVLFCKSVNIPFEVYAFTSVWDFDSDSKTHQTYKVGDIRMAYPVKLLNLFSSRMNKSELTYAGDFLLSKPYVYFRQYQLGGTPLNETIICAMDILEKYKKNNKLQIVNTIFLTDGEGHSLSSIQGITPRVYGDMIIRDPVTKAMAKNENAYYSRNNSEGFLYLLKQRTQCNIIGFRLLNIKDFRAVAFYDEIEHKDEISHPVTLCETFKKNKSVPIKSYKGYDEMFFIKHDSMNIEETDLEYKPTVKGLVNSFKKHSNSNIKNKIMLGRFISIIS